MNLLLISYKALKNGSREEYIEEDYYRSIRVTGSHVTLEFKDGSGNISIPFCNLIALVVLEAKRDNNSIKFPGFLE